MNNEDGLRSPMEHPTCPGLVSTPLVSTPLVSTSLVSTRLVSMLASRKPCIFPRIPYDVMGNFGHVASCPAVMASHKQNLSVLEPSSQPVPI